MLAQRLRYIVSIQQRSTSINAYGENDSNTWNNFAVGVYASIEPFSAKEYLAANATHGEKLVRIVIRYLYGVNNTMRIMWQSDSGTRYFDITGVISDNEKNRMMTLLCVEGLNDGGR